ncbi:MAG: MFS transporter, partial [Candidatus Omnitrophica bacterium]|nr:MFS transporter [Candidatus Omnitrophota bacterium]
MSNKATAPKASAIKFMLRALKNRNYRLFFYGQSISLIGTWMQSVAVSWLVYSLTGSAFLLGVVGFASQIPALILAPFSGVLADRFNKHRIIIITQTLAMIQAFALTFLAFTGTIEVWHIVVLSIFLGLVNAFDMPTRQSFVVEMVEDRQDLSNAIALNSLIFNGARLIGPAIAGIIISLAGEKICFLLNAVSYIAVIWALLIMRIKTPQQRQAKKHIWHELKEGFSYAFGSLPIRYILMLFALINLMGVSFNVLMPVFAKDILHGGPNTLGFLIGSAGFGALLGAIFVASRKETKNLTRLIPLAAALFGAGLSGFSFSRNIFLSYALMGVIGFGMMIQIASSNTLLQTLTSDHLRGRVMSIYTMAFIGMVTLGSLLVGSLAGKIGAPHTLFFGGIFCLAGALFFLDKSPF